MILNTHTSNIQTEQELKIALVINWIEKKLQAIK